MNASAPAIPLQGRKTPCPYCGKPYRTLLKRTYMQRIDGGIKQSVPAGAQWRCLSCGKSYSTEDE